MVPYRFSTWGSKLLSFPHRVSKQGILNLIEEREWRWNRKTICSHFIGIYHLVWVEEEVIAGSFPAFRSTLVYCFLPALLSVWLTSHAQGFYDVRVLYLESSTAVVHVFVTIFFHLLAHPVARPSALPSVQWLLMPLIHPPRLNNRLGDISVPIIWHYSWRMTTLKTLLCQIKSSLTSKTSLKFLVGNIGAY